MDQKHQEKGDGTGMRWARMSVGGGAMTRYMMALAAMARILNFILKYRGIRGFQGIMRFHFFWKLLQKILGKQQ